MPIIQWKYWLLFLFIFYLKVSTAVRKYNGVKKYDISLWRRNIKWDKVKIFTLSTSKLYIFYLSVYLLLVRSEKLWLIVLFTYWRAVTQCWVITLTHIMATGNKSISLFTCDSLLLYFDSRDKNMGEQIAPSPPTPHLRLNIDGHWQLHCCRFRCEYLWCATYKIHGPFTAVLDLLRGFEAIPPLWTDRTTSPPAVFHEAQQNTVGAILEIFPLIWRHKILHIL